MPITVKPAMQSQKEPAAVELMVECRRSTVLRLVCVVIFAQRGENHYTKGEDTFE
jgi:hypothetical protein